LTDNNLLKKEESHFNQNHFGYLSSFNEIHFLFLFIMTKLPE